MNCIAIYLCNKDRYYTFLLNWPVVYWLSTAMSSVTGNQTVDLFYLLKEEISYLTYHGKELREFVLFTNLFGVTRKEILKNTLEAIRDIESDLAYTKVLGVASRCILWSGIL